jgi:hypothetical protein
MEAVGATGVYMSVFHTQNATAVASGTHFDDDQGSLRTAVIDVGDPDQVGDWGWLSYRVPEGQTDFQVTLRLLDAATGEVLFERTDSRTNPSYNISLVSIDDHPRVVIEMLLENRKGFSEARVEHLEINWTDRLPVPPTVLSLTAVNDTVYRTNGTALRVQVEDESDRPQFMKVTVQMRPPGATGWLSDRIGTPVWEDGNWTVPFAPTRDDETGPYDFRAYVTDSDRLSSPLLEVEDLVTVLNNPPGTPGIAVLPAEPMTGHDLVCSILRQAYDADTSHVDYEFEWSLDGVLVPDLVNDTVPSGRTAKGQTWRVRARAFDGEDRGPWVEALATVANSPPALVGEFGPLELLEDDPPVVLRVRDVFSDPDGDPLSIEHSGEGPLVISVDEQAGTITVAPPADWYGRQEVTFNVSDGETVLSEVLVVEAFSVNDPPRVVSIGGNGPVDGRFLVNATQGTESYYLVVVEDADSDRFRFRSDAKFGAFEVVSANGTIIFTPANSEVGLVSFNLSVEDWEYNSVVVPVDVQVADLNDPPGPVRILQPKNAMTFEYDSEVLMQGSCEDPDERHGQPLIFTWISSIDGVLDLGPSIIVTGLSPGDHTLTLEVSDGEYTRDKSIQIRVKPAPEDPGNGGPSDPGDDDPQVSSPGGGALPWVLLALVLVALGALLVLVRRRRPRREALPTEAPEKEEIRVVDGIKMPAGGPGAEGDGTSAPSLDMMDGIMGRAPVPEGPGEDIPASPWRDQDLDFARRPMPASPPVAAAGAFDASEWEEAEEGDEEEDEAHVVTTPLPPPPPPAATPHRPVVPAPPPPGVPSRQQPPKRPVVEEDEWEEVD